MALTIEDLRSLVPLIDLGLKAQGIEAVTNGNAARVQHFLVELNALTEAQVKQAEEQKKAEPANANERSVPVKRPPRKR